MNDEVIITCAVTGAGQTVGIHPAIPVTPEQIANAALEAASAGAAVVHCHVRDPKTGKGARGVHLYREVMERIRAKNKDVIINLTAGMGGDLEIGARIVAGDVDAVVFLRDPLTSHPHEPDIQALLKVCDIHGVPLATNLASAEILLRSLSQAMWWGRSAAESVLTGS